VVRCGKDIYVDRDTHSHVWNFVIPTIVEWSKKYRVHVISTGGHSDGVFCPVAPGIIVASHWLKIYDKTFPDWEIYQLGPEKNPGVPFQKWWIDNKEISINSKFSKHIEQYALDWIGNYQETQFSVNMLVLDEKTVLAVNDNSPLCAFLSSKGIEVIVADFRCKNFWDGGMHCLTCDIVRDGPNQDYFPQRPQLNYLDWM
jgi:N-dimethylarginine dimethylaminohydrolase